MTLTCTGPLHQRDAEQGEYPGGQLVQDLPLRGGEGVDVELAGRAAGRGVDHQVGEPAGVRQLRGVQQRSPPLTAPVNVLLSSADNKALLLYLLPGSVRLLPVTARASLHTRVLRTTLGMIQKLRNPFLRHFRLGTPPFPLHNFFG